MNAFAILSWSSEIRPNQEGAGMNRMLPPLECQKTDFNCPITSKNGDLTVNELPSAQISSFTLISKALFTENRRKKNR